MTALWIIIAAALALAAGFLAGQVLGYKAGHAAGRDQESARRDQRDLTDRERARKAPKPPPPGPEIYDIPPPRITWTVPGHDPYAELPDTRAPFPVYMAPGRTAVTAGDIKPVEVPEPRLTDTGELRAIAERGAAIRARLTGTFGVIP